MILRGLKTGFYGVYIPDSSRMVRSFIEKCVDCTRNKLQINKVEIGAKFPIRNGDIPGVMRCVGIDILGPYFYKVGPTTRARSPLKCWILMVCCQVTSGVAFFSYDKLFSQGAYQGPSHTYGRVLCPGEHYMRCRIAAKEGG